nr:uncharacterized protein LOC106837715 isoform X3 [Equus asinus]XP_044633138.1 uncharacterized protein LOC106837715 isoform X3 [Equus asinus]
MGILLSPARGASSRRAEGCAPMSHDSHPKHSSIVSWKNTGLGESALVSTLPLNERFELLETTLTLWTSVSSASSVCYAKMPENEPQFLGDNKVNWLPAERDHGFCDGLLYFSLLQPPSPLASAVTLLSPLASPGKRPHQAQPVGSTARMSV